MIVKVQPDIATHEKQPQVVSNISEFAVDDDNGGFENYVKTTVDSGSTFLVMTVLFCLFSQLLLPCMVTLDSRRSKRRKRVKNGQETTKQMNGEKKEEHPSKLQLESRIQEKMPKIKRSSSSIFHESKQSAGRVTNGILTAIQRNGSRKRLPHEDCEQNVDLLNQSVETSCCSESEESAPNFKSACTSIASSFVSAIRKKRDNLFNVKKAKRCRRGGRNWIAFGDDIPYRYFEDDVLYNGTQATVHNGEECNNNTWDESYRQFALELALKSSASDEDGSIDRHSRSKFVILDVGIPFAVDDNTLASPSSVDKDFSSNAHASPSKNNSQGQNLNDDDDTILNLCCGQNAWWKPATISQAFQYVTTLATYDKETRSILKLAIPYSFSAVMDAIFEAIGI
eukprot:scaffold70859_cov51-Attheya_sp.AAC.4